MEAGDGVVGTMRAVNHRRNPYIYISGIFAAAWVYATWVSPEADFVLFPILIAFSVPVSYRLGGSPLALPVATGAGAAGAINTAVIALVLNLFGGLAEANMIPALGPVGQAIVLGLGGAVLGVLVSLDRGEAR